ncbi:TIGR03943 family putative permease subunit [Metabacillus dongyingensis]|uniref:TIGR03943 family putative permease subunit n=1 Tax=Metabacillus dongyingensis TaxID=2874282 RepID=UPI001CBD8786|nr:TIGR03943 family protein [Metabacillus dongyingensis]UAL52122.1 TIGR03943 family protein [Metabacillus dongyingensis]
MKKFLTALGLLIIAGIVFMISMQPEKEEREPEKQEATQEKEEPLANAKEYLEDPDGYMKKLDEKYKPDHEDDHHAEDKPDEYYENQKNDLLKMDKIILSNENYISILEVLDRFPKEFAGKQVELTGFVFREKDFSETQLVIARSGDPCCTDEHDGLYGLLSRMENAKNLLDSQWVNVTGELSTNTYSGAEVPYLLIKKAVKIKPPAQPYVYEGKDTHTD